MVFGQVYALEADIPALTDIKGIGSEAIHRDRLRDAQDAGFQYLVLLADQEVIGFACLVHRRPSYWSDADDMQNLPQIVDLQVKESHRGHGYGSDFIHALERIAAEAGSAYLYLSVEPGNSPPLFSMTLREAILVSSQVRSTRCKPRARAMFNPMRNNSVPYPWRRLEGRISYPICPPACRYFALMVVRRVNFPIH